MKFASVAVLAVVAPLASGFVTSSNQRQLSAAFVGPSPSRVVGTPLHRAAGTSSLSMALSDLEKKLLDPKPEPKAAATSKPEKKKPAAKKEEPKPAPKPAPVPAKATKGKASYDLGGVEAKPKPEKKAPAPKVEKPKVVVEAPKKAEKAAPKPKPVPVAKAPVVKAVTPAAKDPNAVPAGVALGAAPLLLAPVALLAAGRGALQGTKERRDKIQKEIAAFEAAKAKKAVAAEVDGGGVVSALVSGKKRNCENWNGT